MADPRENVVRLLHTQLLASAIAKQFANARPPSRHHSMALSENAVHHVPQHAEPFAGARKTLVHC